MSSSKANYGDLDAFQLIRATPEDAHGIHACSNRAFGNSYLHSKVYPEEKAHLTPPEELFAWRVKRLRKAMAADDFLYFKIIHQDEPQKVVAYAGWYTPGHFQSSNLSDTYGNASIKTNTEADMTAQGVLEAPATTGETSHDFPACMDVEVHKEFLAKLDEERKKIWGDNADYWYLGAIAVDPEHRRQGLASMLMKEGLVRTDADGIPTYLEATPEGALMCKYIRQFSHSQRLKHAPEGCVKCEVH